MAGGWPALRRHRGRGRGGDAPVLVVDWLAGTLTIARYARYARCAWGPFRRGVVRSHACTLTAGMKVRDV